MTIYVSHTNIMTTLFTMLLCRTFIIKLLAAVIGIIVNVYMYEMYVIAYHLTLLHALYNAKPCKFVYSAIHIHPVLYKLRVCACVRIEKR